MRFMSSGATARTIGRRDMPPDLDGAYRLLLAVSLEWCRAAQKDETELTDLAAWLEVDREALRRSLARRIAQPAAR